MQRQENLINDLITAADGLQNLNTNTNTQQDEYLRQAFPTTRPATNLGAPSNETNANTQQLQNTQQHEYLRQAFPTNPPAANCVVPSNEKTTSSKFHNYSMRLICCFYCFCYFYFFLLFFVVTSFSV